MVIAGNAYVGGNTQYARNYMVKFMKYLEDDARPFDDLTRLVITSQTNTLLVITS